MKKHPRTQKQPTVVEWVSFIPNQGHVFTQYVDGKAVWLAGVYLGR